MNMKTSKLANETPLPKLTGKFCVMRQSHTVKRMVFTAVHDDVLSATEEAQRLHAEKPDLRYLVMKVVTAIGP
jgi:endonuclease V-like protein UPF0215 family